MRQLLLILLLIIQLSCFSQKLINIKDYNQISDSLRYDDALLQSILSDIDTYYWEYRHRDTRNLYKLMTQNSDKLDKLKDSLKYDYTIKQKSHYIDKQDSIKISNVNADDGMIECIPDGNCFNYLIYVKNDTIRLIDNYDSLKAFILPIDNYKKAFLWCLWSGYSFSTIAKWTGYYSIMESGCELIMQKTTDSRQLEDGTWEDNIQIVHLTINSQGQIIETLIEEKKWNYEFKIVV
jgi:hypothetical protein